MLTPAAAATLQVRLFDEYVISARCAPARMSYRAVRRLRVKCNGRDARFSAIFQSAVVCARVFKVYIYKHIFKSSDIYRVVARIIMYIIL